MGLYDMIDVAGDWCRCSEGHDLRGEPLQTKDLGCTMGVWGLADELSGEPGLYGDLVSTPFSGTLAAYTYCRECPSFLEPGTWNILSAWVEFDIHLDESRLTEVRRVSQPSVEWIASERAAGSIGPMTLEDAGAECSARRARERGSA